MCMSRCRHQNMETYFRSDDLQMQQQPHGDDDDDDYDSITSIHFIRSSFSIDWIWSFQVWLANFWLWTRKKHQTHSKMDFSSDHVLILFRRCDAFMWFRFGNKISLVENCWNILNTMTQTEKKNTKQKNVRLTNNLLFVPMIIIKSIDTWWNENGSSVRTEWAIELEHNKKEREWIIQEGPCSTYW